MKRDYLKYILALLLFGSNGIVAATISLSSLEIAFLRTVLGSLSLLTIFLCLRKRITCFAYKKDLLKLIGAGFFLGLSWVVLFEAYQRIGVGLATIEYYLGPVLVILSAPIFFKERLTWPKLTGLSAVALGMLLLNGMNTTQAIDSIGVSCGLLAACFYSAMVILSKKAQHIEGLERVAIQMLASMVTVGLFILPKQGLIITIPRNDWIPVLILGLVNTGFSCYLYFSSIGNLPVQSAAVCGYTEPLSAIFLSTIFLGEMLLPLQTIGAMMILGGSLFAQCMKSKVKFPRHRISSHNAMQH